MTALEPGCPVSPEPPTSPGCLANASVPRFCSSPHWDPVITLAIPWGQHREGLWSTYSRARASPGSAGSRGIPLAGPGCPAASCPARDSVLGAGQQRWLKFRRAGRPGAAEITNTCLFLRGLIFLSRLSPRTKLAEPV